MGAGVGVARLEFGPDGLNFDDISKIDLCSEIYSALTLPIFAITLVGTS